MAEFTHQDSRPAFLLEVFTKCLEQLHPNKNLEAHLPDKPVGRTFVVGAGKAAASMALAFEESWQWDYKGIVVTRYGYSVPTNRIKVLVAAHPIPDHSSVAAAHQIHEFVSEAQSGDLVICLLSGGGSSLLTLPSDGISLSDKILVNKALLKCGAAIEEINCVRKHLSAIKGGKLAIAAFPAETLTLAISDVPGDNIHTVASSPTVLDFTTAQDALDVLLRHKLEVPENVWRLLERQTRSRSELEPTHLHTLGFKFIATPSMMLRQAQTLLETSGYHVVNLGDEVVGEAREIAKVHAGIAKRASAHGKPVAILSGGELTVKISGTGRGGPNREYALALALEFDGDPKFCAIACDSDGADGAPNSGGKDVAGAIVASSSISHENKDLALSSLCANDSGGFFENSEYEIITGPTYNNLNDFRCILVTPQVTHDKGA
ncbi:Putative hydroxypyruvate reductase [Roseibium album]|nr:Putative hydroxypyruvate reductase [Roseibium album]